MLIPSHFPCFGARWLSADAAAVFSAFVDLLLRKTLDAAVAAFALVFLALLTRIYLSLLFLVTSK